MSSIMTIGYISQELAPGNLSAEEIDSVLSALITNLKDPKETEIATHAIIAFLNFIIFASKNMSVDVII